MSVAPGTRLGVYDIAAQIGEGGMGRVFRATDTKLKRQVAIKILPPALAADHHRLARFQREAEVLASLNHPNIAGIYGVEESGGVVALVMELVDGEDLSQRIARGAIPIDESLPIAKQIAEALEAAHEQGIIHRDLKPANIKVRADGTVKVLDFGLARPSGASDSGATSANSPTITSPAMTQAGMILGTAAYMAPEQAKGRTVDRRADVWAFGAVLYEMLSGHRAFAGGDAADTLANVLKTEPNWSRLPAAVPARARQALRACLQKDPKQRLGDMQSVRLALEGAFETAQPRAAQPRAYLPWALAAGSALAASFVVWMAMRVQPAADLPVARVLLGVGPAERLLSGYPGDLSAGQGRPSRTAMAFSPDGRSLVFSAEREGQVRLYIRRLDQLDAIPIAGTEGASNPFFSPDGQSLGFYAAGALRRVPVGGGPVVEICKADLEGSNFPSPVFGASWSHNGQIVFANLRGGLWQVPAAGGTPVAVTKLQSDAGEVSHRLPQVLPDGVTVLFTVTNAGFPSWDDTRIVAQSLTTGTQKVLIEGAADARFVSTGHLVYLRKGTLMAVPFDLGRLEVSGPAVGVVSDVMQAADIQPLQIDTGAGQFAVSSTGALVYATGGVFSQDRWSLVWVDRTGRSEALRVPPGAYANPRLSPDGRRVAFNSTSGDWDVWTYEVQRGVAARVSMEGQQAGPVWTPDGSRLAFSSSLGRDVTGPLLLVDPDGRSPAERLTRTTVTGLPASWTPEGRALAFTLFTFDGVGTSPASPPRNEIWVASRDGKTEPRQLLPEGRAPEFSADGRWLAYISGSPPQVYVQPYPALDRRVQVSTDGGINPAWRRDGREMYYLQTPSAGGALKVQVMAVPVVTGPAFSAGTPRLLFEGPFRTDGPSRSYDVAPDGQRFLMVQEVQRPQAQVSQMVLVQNWVEELKRLAPPK